MSMKTFGLLGWSGSGKTTLVVKLLPELRRRGFTVSTIKHTHHKVDVDRPGKDSFRHREAGAKEVVLVSSARWALLHELDDEPEPGVEDLIARMTPVDLLLIEGFKTYPHAKLEVHRPAFGKALIGGDDPSVVAIASDQPLDGVAVPVLDLNDIPAIADFIVGYCQLTAVTENGAA
jgi:molybdopterin-guanine dinucleotide biosynthesis protein B